MMDLTKKEGWTLPQIGLGCMSLPEDFQSAKLLIDKALDLGISFFDTADLYQRGENERNLGKALKGKRPQVILASKVGNQWNAEGTAWSWNPTKAYILQAVEASLKRLQTDYLDLYQLHGGTLEDPWDETLEAFEVLQSQGKIRAFGISSIRPNVIRKVMSMSQPKTIMMQYSPLDRRPEEEVFPFLEKSQTKVLVRGSFAKGLLINKPETNFLDLKKDQVREIRQTIVDSGFMPEAVLIRFGLEQKSVGSVIIGASSVSQLEKIMKGYRQSAQIPRELIHRLKADFPANRYEEHR